MSSEEILQKVANSIVAGDVPGVEAASRQAVEAGISPQVILEQGGNKGLDIVGKKFESLEMFLPEMIASAETMKVLNKLVLPLLQAEGLSKKKGGVAVIGTVYGDTHDLGKNIVTTQLSLHGYEIHDLGTNVPAKDFLEAAKEKEASIIGMSSLLTTSSFYQKDLIDYLKKVGKRSSYFVIVGGGVITEEWAEEIGADGYGRGATDAVTLCNTLLEGSEKPGTGTVGVFQGSTKKHPANNI